ncbi:MAG: phospho-N-acetylmuramoyl-pentapeptide-transferase [Acidimicrobiia bacterium]|nr:phospho-N-acetylmuramoyl-pentapeptide-transferase [Acidimicrobiia bacterium]
MIGLLLAAALGMVVSLVGTRFLIDLLRARKIGQPIHEDVPSGHTVKAGTPTMGGIVIVVGAIVGYLGAHVREGVIFTRSGLLVLGAIAGAGAVGLFDDWIKVSRERNLGLSKRGKMGGLVTVAVAFATLAAFHAPVHFTLGFTRFDSTGIDLARPVWIVLTMLMILAATNAVNLADGLDGLAAGSSIFAFTAFVVIGFWALTHPAYELPHAFDLAVVAAAMLGACTGFLWWNAAPARIIMGDTGSLAIGSGLACLAALTSTQLLFPIAAGLFVFETMSVILQVGSFRLTGKRIFRIAPVHHHFEMVGWPETTVVVRFWILAGLCTAAALGLFYADFVGNASLGTGSIAP